MRYLKISNVLWVIACVVTCTAATAAAGGLRAWGQDYDGQVTGLPAGQDYTAIAAGDAHGLALRSDGTIVAWGQNDDGECNVPAGTYKAIGAGADFSLAIRNDGSIAAWGSDVQGQVSRVPVGRDFVAVEGGEFFAVALKADGSIVAWGSDRWGQVSGTPRDKGFTAVVAGDDHAVALRPDGSLVSWGYWAATEGTPTDAAYTDISAGGSQSLALRNDGSVVWWGADRFDFGLASVPAGNDYADVAAGYLHCLAVKKDGSAVGWGAGTRGADHPNWGQANPPAGNDYKAIAGGLYFSLALTGEVPDGSDGGKGGDGSDNGNGGADGSHGGDVNVPAMSDDFNDDSQDGAWQLYGDDLLSCWLRETNQRLELGATGKAAGADALYLGNGWQIDPTRDFSFRVSVHFGLSGDQSGWVGVGLVPDTNELSTRYVKFGAGCDRQYPYFWYEAIDGLRRQIDFADRRQNDGVLYVSYDAASDVLYLSNVGYGSTSAWGTIRSLLKTSWGGQPVRLFLGGGSEGLQINSGDVYLDDFVIDTGSVIRQTVPGMADVYRFWSPVTGRHFYTLDEAEKEKLVNEYAGVWIYEGPVFKAATIPFLAGLAPVYRFWSDTGLTHFYTIDEAEKERLVKENPQLWRLEGVAFYAWPDGKQPKEAKPVYQFWDEKGSDYFYTIDESEKEKLIREFSHVYAFQGIAFYAGQ